MLRGDLGRGRVRVNSYRVGLRLPRRVEPCVHGAHNTTWSAPRLMCRCHRVSSRAHPAAQNKDRTVGFRAVFGVVVGVDFCVAKVLKIMFDLGVLAQCSTPDSHGLAVRVQDNLHPLDDEIESQRKDNRADR